MFSFLLGVKVPGPWDTKESEPELEFLGAPPSRPNRETPNTFVLQALQAKPRSETMHALFLVGCADAEAMGHKRSEPELVFLVAPPGRPNKEATNKLALQSVQNTAAQGNNTCSLSGWASRCPGHGTQHEVNLGWESWMRRQADPTRKQQTSLICKPYKRNRAWKYVFSFWLGVEVLRPWDPK